MEFTETSSGLVVPKAPPLPKDDEPARTYGPLEITDGEKRDKAHQALIDLWGALQLSKPGGGIRLPGKPTSEVVKAHRRLYFCVGELLLGDDCPEFEEYT